MRSKLNIWIVVRCGTVCSSNESRPIVRHLVGECDLTMAPGHAIITKYERVVLEPHYQYPFNFHDDFNGTVSHVAVETRLL